MYTKIAFMEELHLSCGENKQANMWRLALSLPGERIFFLAEPSFLGILAKVLGI